jgi:hypothetical protein
MRYDIDSSLNETVEQLPITPQNSSVCLAHDLDLDGHAEVFVFDGDGFGNATLRIYSAPTYALKDTFFFEGSNVVPATAVLLQLNRDTDGLHIMEPGGVTNERGHKASALYGDAEGGGFASSSGGQSGRVRPV